MRKRRKAKVVWLPLDLDNRLGTAPVPATSGQSSGTIIKIFTAPPLGAQNTTEEIPIVKDFAGGAGGLIAKQDSTLADIEESGYRLRRIVGKLIYSVQQGVAAVGADPSIFIVTAGFIIRRVNQDGASMAASVGLDQISCTSLNNTMDPWIWRRSWVIADRNAAAIAIDPNVNNFPQSNAVYGAGNFDGPHVDAKTARIVGPEERLFLCTTIEGINGTDQGAPGAVLLIGDTRVLGSLRTNVGNRRNAVR